MDPGGAKAHAFVADLARPQLDAGDRHHLDRVLRVRPDEMITVSDGRGRWRACRLVAGGELEAAGPITAEAAPRPELTVGFALVKGERPEWVVQKLTEIGVDRIVPFVAERSVVRWDEVRAARNHERLVQVARQAAMQCRRVWLPVVEAPASFGELAGRAGAVLAERGGGAPSLDHPVVLVGPEGGWATSERDAGHPTVGLGDTVLRAETAAVAAGVLLTALRFGALVPGGTRAQ